VTVFLRFQTTLIIETASDSLPKLRSEGGKGRTAAAQGALLVSLIMHMRTRYP
jgi:hypothetical protein